MENLKFQNFLLLTLIMSVNIRNISAEDFLYHILNSKDKLPVLSSNWMAYIQKYLEKSIHKYLNVEKNTPVTDVLFQLYRRSNILKNSSVKSVTRNTIYNSHQIIHFIKSPLFTLRTSLYYFVDWGIRVSFNLDKKLRLNFTFNTLRVLGYCDLRTKEGFVITSSSDQQESIDFEFCGIYSRFPLYVPFKRASFMYEGSSKAFEKMRTMNAIGSVISAHVVANVHMIMNQALTYLTHFISMRSMFVHIFRIVVDKHMCVLLKAKQILSFIVFDGPGIHSPSHKIFPFRASAFQCLLQVTHHEMYIDIHAMVSYTGVITAHNFINISNQNVFNNIFYDSGSQFGIQRYHILSPKNSHLNISLIYFSHSGRQSTECQFGGMVILEPSSSGMRAIFQVCNKVTERNIFYLGEGQNIYVKHDITMIIFSHKYYSHILTSSTVSFTLCYIIKVNPCATYEGIQNILKTSISWEMSQCTIIDVTPSYESGYISSWNKFMCPVCLKFNYDSSKKLNFLQYTTSGYYQTLLTYPKQWIKLPYQSKVFSRKWYPDGRRSTSDQILTGIIFEPASSMSFKLSFLAEIHETIGISLDFEKYSYQWVQIIIKRNNNKDNKIVQINIKPITIVNAIRTSRYEALLIKVKELGKGKVWFKFKGFSRPSDATYLLETAVKFSISHLLHKHQNSIILAVPGAFHHLEISLLQKHLKTLEYNWLSVDPAKFSVTGQISPYSDGSNTDTFLYQLIVHSEGVEYHILEMFSGSVRRPHINHIYVQKRCISRTQSWNQALKYCISIGGSLPEVKSRKEQEKLTTILEGLDAFSFEAIYIGLKRR